LPSTTYQYTIRQSTSLFSSNFTTAPTAKEPIRFIVYADSETEPESTGKHGKWPDKEGKIRPYLLDQTDGYKNNLAVIQSRKPHFIAIPGDLVESGGEQRDWDEFWRHNTSLDGQASIASKVPFLATPGNHEYYESPMGDRYNQPGSQRAINRYQIYFEFPTNNSPNAKQHGLYHRTDFGPVTMIALDVANDGPHKTDRDTNFFLLGENDEQGGNAPAFKPGSTQYIWLEKQLADAQQRSAFTFVYFHHVPYSVGPHGWAAGESIWIDWWKSVSDFLSIDPPELLDTQSGVPIRILTPLFMRYGVDAVFSGHDEMFERSELHGNERTIDGLESPHVIHFYDVGIGGDGLRGPQTGLHNPHQAFLAHTHAPEVWQDSVLIDGGKHYGHLEVDILPARDGRWQAVMKPVYVFPVFDAQHNYLRSERRLYDDIVALTERKTAQESTLFGFEPTELRFDNLSTALLRYHITEEAAVQTTVYSDDGEAIRLLEKATKKSGLYSVEWDGRNNRRQQVEEGTYTVQLVANGMRDSVNVYITR
ncbi:MAG: metallophosphoesterase, partial [Candidatus Latescibacterota bacterium]|nr:metallophosphoesterase [Candidatus Latescibacterota bacterium]